MSSPADLLRRIYDDQGVSKKEIEQALGLYPTPFASGKKAYQRTGQGGWAVPLEVYKDRDGNGLCFNTGSGSTAVLTDELIGKLRDDLTEHLTARHLAAGKAVDEVES